VEVGLGADLVEEDVQKAGIVLVVVVVVVLAEGECPIVGDGLALEVDRRSSLEYVVQLIGEEDRWQKQ